MGTLFLSLLFPKTTLEVLILDMRRSSYPNPKLLKICLKFYLTNKKADPNWVG